ncbi:Iron-sulfur assembly protein 1 [Malassezia cuniculi]|uniref:Iron-sulfur assembly protein 1 n=1 Tax=Malassezia cuniculi TaxID=948313 RepID=A0AAF0J7M5_9BASI|nr:Iron-sulfur assembly protein 1 [Malassezia cuniculi]
MWRTVATNANCAAAGRISRLVACRTTANVQAVSRIARTPSTVRWSSDAAAAGNGAAPLKRTVVADKLKERARKKAAITLRPAAVERLRALLSDSDSPKLIRISVRNKGCAGMSYHFEYVKPEEKGRFDEVVKQDGVEVLIDSRALFSIIGSEMDWKEDRLSARFVFDNPNIKDACGCGESFLV